MIHSLSWITIFGSLVMRFANDFHSWLRHSWKLLANRLTRDPKIVVHGNSCIILYVLHFCLLRYSHKVVFLYFAVGLKKIIHSSSTWKWPTKEKEWYIIWVMPMGTKQALIRYTSVLPGVCELTGHLENWYRHWRFQCISYRYCNVTSIRYLVCSYTWLYWAITNSWKYSSNFDGWSESPGGPWLNLLGRMSYNDGRGSY